LQRTAHQKERHRKKRMRPNAAGSLGTPKRLVGVASCADWRIFLKVRNGMRGKPCKGPASKKRADPTTKGKRGKTKGNESTT